MKKPAPTASRAAWAQYREWVREQLKDWDPADDRGGPHVYTPRHNGIRASEIENVQSKRADSGPFSTD